MLHRALPFRTPRLRCKLRMLRWMVERLSREFDETAMEIAECASIDPAGDWQRLGDLHSDLNTCLHEITVLFKSFLRALPAEDFAAFRQRLEARPALLAPQPGLFRAST